MFSVTITYLLWLLSGCGVLGFHRFYLKKVPTGILYFFSAGLCGFGAFYDLITIPHQVREANLKAKYMAAMEYEKHMGKPIAFSNNHSNEIIDDRKKTKNTELSDANIEQEILKLAKSEGGIVTPGSLALEIHISLKKAEENLHKLVANSFAEMRITKDGRVVYLFKEFITDFTDLNLAD